MASISGELIKRKLIPTHETEPLFLYRPIKSETYSLGARADLYKILDEFEGQGQKVRLLCLKKNVSF